jgi:hypothetical protein
LVCADKVGAIVVKMSVIRKAVEMFWLSVHYFSAGIQRDRYRYKICSGHGTAKVCVRGGEDYNLRYNITSECFISLLNVSVDLKKCAVMAREFQGHFPLTDKSQLHNALA